MGRITLQGALRFDLASSIFPEADDRRRPLPAGRHDVPGNQGRRCVQGPDAARRRRVRRLRQRQDGGQGQLRPLSRSGAERRAVRRQPADVARLDDGDAHVDRRERQLRARLRPVEQRAAGSARERRRLLRRGRRTPTSASRSSTRRRIRRCSPAGACGPATGSAARRSSSSCAASVGRGRLLPALAERTSSSPTTSTMAAGNFDPFTDHGAGRCAAARTAAAMRFPVRCTTSTRQRRLVGGQQLRHPRQQLRRTRRRRRTAISLNISARPRNGLVFQGGFNTAQTLVDYCAIRAAMPELTTSSAADASPTNPYCKHQHGLDHAVHRPRVVHAAEDRRADRRHGAQRPGRHAGGELGGAQLGDRAVARPATSSNNAPTATVNLISRGRCTAIASTRSISASRRFCSSAGRGPTSASTSTTCSTARRC